MMKLDENEIIHVNILQQLQTMLEARFQCTWVSVRQLFDCALFFRQMFYIRMIMDTDDIVKHYEFFISIDAYAGKQELFREMRYIEDRVNLVKEFASHGIHLCDGDFYLTPKIEIKVKEENSKTLFKLNKLDEEHNDSKIEFMCNLGWFDMEKCKTTLDLL